MRKPLRRAARRARRKFPARRRAWRGSLWRWLGLGALGLAGWIWLARRPRASGSRSATAEGSRPEPEPVGESAPGELPASAAVAWIAGPGGTLRFCEVNPERHLPIVFVHGLGGRLEHWAATLAMLGPGLRGIALDLPGHGESDAMEEGSRVAQLASALTALADGLALRRMILVGHSLGAVIAAAYAGAHPQRVAGLLLLDPSGDQTRIPAGELDAHLAAVANDPLEELEGAFRVLLQGSRQDVVKRVLEDLAATSPEVLAAMVEGAVTHSPVADLERYPGPVRSLVTDRNSLPYSLHRLRPELPATRVGDLSHWLMLDRPELFGRLLQEFLDEVRAGRVPA